MGVYAKVFFEEKVSGRTLDSRYGGFFELLVLDGTLSMTKLPYTLLVWTELEGQDELVMRGPVFSVRYEGKTMEVQRLPLIEVNGNDVASNRIYPLVDFGPTSAGGRDQDVLCHVIVRANGTPQSYVSINAGEFEARRHEDRTIELRLSPQLLDKLKAVTGLSRVRIPPVSPNTPDSSK